MEETKKRTLVGQLKDSLEGLSAGEIEEVMVETKREALLKAVGEQKNNSLVKLINLFDSQIETLGSRGCPPAILKALQNKKSEVIDKAIDMEDIPEENIAFLPVIPRAYMGIHGLMSMIRNGNKLGYAKLDPYKITNDKKRPEDLYYIFDVETGNFSECMKKVFKERNRLCHVPEEDIAICIFTDVLSDRDLWSKGSFYETNDKVPILSLDRVSGSPCLTWSFESDREIGSLRNWGSASSCR